MTKIRYAYSRKQSWTKLVEKLIVGVIKGRKDDEDFGKKYKIIIEKIKNDD